MGLERRTLASRFAYMAQEGGENHWIGERKKGMNDQDNTLLSAACRYAHRGWYVIPLHSSHNGRCSCSRPTCSSVGKHPRTVHGLKDATTDAALIRQWWTQWPDTNVGIVTGSRSGVVVMDIDPRNGGDNSFTDLERTYGPVPNTIESLTGGGGRHLFFQHPGDVIKSRPIEAGLDIKADGGYVVAPPSHHASGKLYVWKQGGEPDTKALSPLSQWLLQWMKDKATSSTSARSISEWRRIAMSGIGEGQRNTWVTRLVGHLLRHGIDPVVALYLIAAWNQVHNRPPLPQDEVIRTVNAIAGRELRRRQGGRSHG